MKLVIAEKPSVAMSLAAVLGATERKDGYLEGSGYLVSWCVPAFMTLQLCKGNVTVFMAIRLNRPLIMCNLSMKRSWQPIRERTASI